MTNGRSAVTHLHTPCRTSAGVCSDYSRSAFSGLKSATTFQRLDLPSASGKKTGEATTVPGPADRVIPYYLWSPFYLKTIEYPSSEKQLFFKVLNFLTFF